MGRGSTSHSTTANRMRRSLLLLLLVLVLILPALIEGGKKGGKKPSKKGKGGSKKPSKASKGGGKKPSKNKGPQIKGSCKTTGPKLTKKNTQKYTKSSSGCECWWDITKKNCACCNENVGAMQCGWPMHKFCYKKSVRGCPGVCNNKYTLSGKGYPCYSDLTRTDCAWCNKYGYQCEQTSRNGPQSKRGSRCQDKRNKNYCESQQGDCQHIPYCDPNAKCKLSSKVGKFNSYWQCKCQSPYEGNGIQCKDKKGNLSPNPDLPVEVQLKLEGELYKYPHDGGELSEGVSMEALLKQMKATNGKCKASSKDCEASFSHTEL